MAETHPETHQRGNEGVMEEPPDTALIVALAVVVIVSALAVMFGVFALVH